MPDSFITEIKAENLKLQKLEQLINATVVKSYPSIYYIDPGNRCNLRCALCPIKYSENDIDMPRGFMSDKLYLSILDKIKDYSIELHLYNWGEPLLHP